MERGLSLAGLAELVPCHRGYVAQLEHGTRRPSVEFAMKLDEVLGGGSILVELAAQGAQAPAGFAGADDELDTGSSSLGGLPRATSAIAVLTGLEQAADRLAIGYQSTAPIVLLPEIRRHLDYVGQLLDKRATLGQRRRLLVVGGWLSLLAATVDIGLNLRPVAAARLDTATSLAEQAGHAEIVAWCLETRAWDALTERDYRRAADLSQAAQRVAPRDGSAFIQATAQEGRAWARLGDQRQARHALARVERLASPLPVPDQPEHHFPVRPGQATCLQAPRSCHGSPIRPPRTTLGKCVGTDSNPVATVVPDPAASPPRD